MELQATNKTNTANTARTTSATQINHSVIDHFVRRKLGITMNEYVVADLIEKLGNAPENRRIGGWVFATKQTIAENLGFSRRTIIRAINTLVEKKIVERGESNLLKTTSKWYYE